MLFAHCRACWVLKMRRNMCLSITTQSAIAAMGPQAWLNTAQRLFCSLGMIRGLHCACDNTRLNCGGLADTVEVAMGARIMLRCNVCTADGLFNGAMGTTVGFEWSQGQRTANTQPSGISVLFDNCKVGRMTRNSTENAPTELCPVTSTFMSRNGKLPQNGKLTQRLERYQYPIVLAWAVTIHKVQGLSLDRAVMDLGESVFAHGMAYVALSRVKPLEGCVIGLSRSAFQKNDTAVHAEYQHLPNLNLM